MFVSGFLPPHAPFGAVRTGKLDEYWRNSGHDVRTIAIALPSKGNTDDLASRPFVNYISYREPGRLITQLKAAIRLPPSGRGRKPSALQPRASLPTDTVPIAKLGLIDLYRQLVQFPDRYRSWINPAMRLGISWKDHWKPDVIYSSGPPHSAHVVAARLASRFHIPWIAELRDLWINDPYFDRHWFIKPFHDLYAKNVLSQAMAFVVVTSKAREHLLEDTDKRVLVSYNATIREILTDWTMSAHLTKTTLR
jgi:hypothetical protein